MTMSSTRVTQDVERSDPTVEATESVEQALHASNAVDKKEAQVDLSPTKGFQWKGWLLAAIISAIILWVCLWTILATHTDVARQKIYLALESKYFPDKAGARVFTYLGVFYLVAGAVTYIALTRGIRLPRPTCWLVQAYRVPLTNWRPSVLELGACLMFVAVQAATIGARIKNRFEVEYWDSERVWYEVSKTLGKTAAVTLMLLLLPICKSCFWWDLFNFHFERAVKFHRWLAWFLVVTVFVHAFSAIGALIKVDQFKNCMWPSDDCAKPGGWGTYDSRKISRIYTYGWLAVLFAIPLVITSLPWFRRNKFEWFYYTHFLFLPFIVLVHLHFPDMIYYMAPGLAAYVLDKVLWWYCSRRRTKIVSLKMSAPGFVRVAIALDKGHTFEPGQWVQIKVPAVSILEWHPMSVSSAPGHSTITIDIKVLGDWTEALAKLAARFDPSSPAHTCIFIDRFYGSSHSEMQGYLNHPVVLMFAGGIGITPMMSAVRSLVEDGGKYPNIRRAVLVWCVKKKSVVDLYREELGRYQSMKTTTSGCQLDIIVHATLSEKEHEAEFVAVEMDSPNARELTEDCEHGPFRQHLMGFRQKLILTLGSGGGYWLGIFAANAISLDKEWRTEYQNLLQLCFAVLFAGTFVFTGINAKSTGIAVSEPSAEGDHVSEGTSKDLDVVLGCRPDVKGIVSEMKDYCETNGYSSVGVSVCGPELLVETVTRTCKEASCASSHFVVDEETFEW